MKILNLVYPEQSDIKYKISKFPDGQQDIVITPFVNISDPAPLVVYDDIIVNHPVKIKSPFNSFRDLEIIIAATKALRRLGVDTIHLYIPYLLGARSDRQFVEGGNSYLVDVIAPIINAQEYKSVTVIDVHSDVAAACIKNLKVIKNTELVSFALRSISTNIGVKDMVMISPDAGAYKKIFDVAKEFGIEYVVTASKVRELSTGKIISTEVPLNPEHYNKTFVIVDDICDGGRTFIEIAKAIKIIFPSAKIHLIVTHGIFSAGFDELGKYFDGIFCTNSIHDLPKAISNFKGEKFVKQLNVF